MITGLLLSSSVVVDLDPVQGCEFNHESRLNRNFCCVFNGPVEWACQPVQGFNREQNYERATTCSQVCSMKCARRFSCHQCGVIVQPVWPDVSRPAGVLPQQVHYRQPLTQLTAVKRQVRQFLVSLTQANA